MTITALLTRQASLLYTLEETPPFSPAESMILEELEAIHTYLSRHDCATTL